MSPELELKILDCNKKIADELEKGMKHRLIPMVLNLQQQQNFPISEEAFQLWTLQPNFPPLYEPLIWFMRYEYFF